ncbi:unnamed protein product [Chilo suppressalis]|uniref:Helitron helicase-like domain-containing protein n=1 Tax=Chilo suppressalis TaxID=168631 RepID=A0ABN8ATP1_CHISP|nr:unnamed protein product [Chilo suppressalis]
MTSKRKSNLAISSSRARAAKLARSLESEKDSQICRTLDAERLATQRAAETFEQTQTRHNFDADRSAAQRAADTSQQTQARQVLDAERHAAQRAAETSQQTQARQVLDAERHAAQRATETSQQTQARQILDAERQASYIAAETSEETRRSRLINSERQAERRLTFTMNTWEAFADAAFDYDPLIDYFNHRLVLIGRMANKCRHYEALKWKEETPALERMPGENNKLVIHPDRTPSEEHERRYKAFLINEVAAMVCGEQFASRDIVLQARDNTLTRAPDTHKFYDALQYPLMFSKGQEGYHFQIPQVNPVTNVPLSNKKVSSMDFYAYHMMIREDDFNVIQRCKQLAYQFYVDM